MKTPLALRLLEFLGKPVACPNCGRETQRVTRAEHITPGTGRLWFKCSKPTCEAKFSRRIIIRPEMLSGQSEPGPGDEVLEGDAAKNAVDYPGRCPVCECIRSRIIKVSPDLEVNTIYRRHVCDNCRFRYRSTQQIPPLAFVPYQWPVRKDRKVDASHEDP